MNAHDATVEMIRDSGKPVWQLERELCKGKGHFSHIVYKGSCPKANTLALLAEACGYELILRRNDGMEIVIAPDKPL